MFLIKLRSLCDEADWIVQCGRTLAGYHAHYNNANTDAAAIWHADINALYSYAHAVVAAGRRSSVAKHSAMAQTLAVAIRQHDAADLIDTFAGII